MREIKFRFWDSKDKKWLVDSKSETNIYDFAFKADMNWDFIDKYKAAERVVVMQYTGLKDKNGREIYESDKLIDESIGELWVVKFDDRGCFVATNPVDDLDFVLLDDLDFTVIGNTYEN